MPNNETTTKFKVDISELKKAMQDAKRSVAVANSEFKAVSSTMDDWSKSSEGISAKLKQLDSNLKNQKSILKSLEAQYELTVKEMGEGSKAADDLKIKINNQKAVVNQTEREISKYEASLEEVSEAEKTAAKTGKTVADVLEDVTEESKDAGEGFTVLKGAVAGFVGNAMTSLVGSIKDGISNIINLADETREYRTELAKLETAATQSGASTDYIKDKWQDLGSVLGDEGAVSEGLNNLMAAGFTTQEEMDAITSHLEGAAIKWKDTLKFEGLSDGLQETLATGSAVGSFSEMLERSGVNLETFNEGLGKCKTEADKQNYVLEQLSKLGLNEVSEAYRSQNKDLIAANKSNAEYTDTLATIGEKVEPVTTAVKEGFNGVLTKVLELVEDVDISAFTSKIQEGFTILTDTVLPAVKDGLGWIIDNKDTVIAGLTGIAAGFVAFKVVSLIQGLVGAFKAWKAATEGMTIAQRLLNLVMSANPIGIVVTLIATIVAALITFIATNDEARAKLKQVWETIKKNVGNAIKSIAKFFTETVPQALDKMVNWFKQLPNKIALWLADTIVKVAAWAGNMKTKAIDTGRNFINNIVNYFKTLGSNVWTWLVNVVSKVIAWRANMIAKAKEVALGFINKVVEFVKQLPSKVWTWLTNVVSKVASWGSSLASKGKEAAKKLFDAVVDKVKEIPGKLLSIGSDIVKGLWNGISNATSWLKSKISGFVGDVTGWLKKFFGINSPSTLMRDEIGKWLPEGMAVGIDKNAKSVLSSMKDLAVNTVGAAKDGLGGAAVSLGTGGAVRGGVVNNYYQTINSPKQLSRLDIYRQSKNLLGYAGGGN